MKTPIAVKFGIRDGTLTAIAKVKSPAERSQAQATIDAVARRWQMEVLGIVAQLLDFDVQITASRGSDGDTITIEGERMTEGTVHEYLRITNDTKAPTVQFEHFSSPERLANAKAKFLALAQRLGVRITVIETNEGGSSIPEGTVHRHFLRGKGKV